MKRLFCTAQTLLMALSVAICATPEKEIKVLYWNIQNGMWAGQYDNYDSFTAWVSEQNPDICIWCEAETIYHTGTYNRMPKEDRYLVKGWLEVAARYGHEYVYLAGHRDSYPQVVTSKFPIENVMQIVGDDDTVVTHGAGWARINAYGKTLNIVTLHTWPQKSHFRYKQATQAERDASAARNEGDINRLEELQWICEHTIKTDKDAEDNLWLMAGDFNAVSPKDNWVYGYDEDDSRLLVHNYILKETPYIDLIWERHPRNFYTTTFERKRIDFVYVTEALYDMIDYAEIIEDSYTKPHTDKNVKSFQNPSDHLPIIVTIKITE